LSLRSVRPVLLHRLIMLNYRRNDVVPDANVVQVNISSDVSPNVLVEFVI
jgi:hypothetical protein